MPTISGTVYDSVGAPAAGRIVRTYRRDTGALLGSAVTSDGLPVAGDPHYANVSLLLHFDGADGSTTFVDSSPRPKTATVIGGVKISTAQSQFGGASSQFDGSDDELFFASNSDFGFGTGDFALEAWVRRKNADCAIFDLRVTGTDASAMVGYISATGYLAWWDNSARISATEYIPMDTWTHVAYCRAAGVLTMYVGGVATRSDVKGSDMGSARALRIGRDAGGNADFYGHLDDIRVTKGVSRYTANFTPPAAPHYDRLPADATPVGSYGITTAYTGEVQRIVLDDDAGDLYNDLIDRVVLA
ncbi:LamG domain-containing protein [Acidovorax sp. IB03]|uniref:LamG domain-containing protein n=1 Tax=Acidovorax sp. IB03 TaxID=2779366 RepID=UPI0018E87AAB|nr:LamG domain-containing protein [Acidovorax sp. IB03]MBJ2162872.1 LamG domain-containing protein [Acidovorax sp. IB03]